MKALKIVSNNKFFNNFYCGNCKEGHNELYRVNGKSFCSKCLPKDIKESDIFIVNQSKERIK